jgi:hypothetical protein
MARGSCVGGDHYFERDILLDKKRSQDKSHSCQVNSEEAIEIDWNLELVPS